MTTAVSIVDSSIYAIPINIFQDRLAASPALNQAVLQILCRKNSLLVGRLLSHSPSDSLQRIAQVLLDMVHAYGTETESGCEISIRFSHQDVANLLHISRVTVTKAFQTMSQEGIPPQSGTHPDLRPKKAGTFGARHPCALTIGPHHKIVPFVLEAGFALHFCSRAHISFGKHVLISSRFFPLNTQKQASEIGCLLFIVVFAFHLP